MPYHPPHVDQYLHADDADIVAVATDDDIAQVENLQLTFLQTMMVTAVGNMQMQLLTM